MFLFQHRYKSMQSQSLSSKGGLYYYRSGLPEYTGNLLGPFETCPFITLPPPSTSLVLTNAGC